MRRIPRNCLFALLLCLLLPAAAAAIPAITCHCFTDRAYDAARPAAADPYFLAATQNSFFAVVFQADKKSLVMKKQQGTAAEDLWIAYWVAARAGISADGLLQDKLPGTAWQDVLAPLGLAPQLLGERFSAALNAHAAAGPLAQAVVDELYAFYRLLGAEELAAIRKDGASNQELIIATLVARKTGQSLRQLYQQVRSGTLSWGALLQRAQIDTRNLQQELRTVLKVYPVGPPKPA